MTQQAITRQRNHPRDYPRLGPSVGWRPLWLPEAQGLLRALLAKVSVCIRLRPERAFSQASPSLTHSMSPIPQIHGSFRQQGNIETERKRFILLSCPLWVFPPEINTYWE